MRPPPSPPTRPDSTFGWARAAPAITVEVARLMAARHAAAPTGDAGALARAFEALERAHGWTRKTLPSRSALAQVARGRGFLEKGSCQERAGMVLHATLDKDGHVFPQHQGRLQATAGADPDLKARALLNAIG